MPVGVGAAHCHGAPVMASGAGLGDSKPVKAHEEDFVARLPASSRCPKKSETPSTRPEVAALRAPVTFAAASEPSTLSGSWEPVTTTGTVRSVSA